MNRVRITGEDILWGSMFVLLAFFLAYAMIHNASGDEGLSIWENDGERCYISDDGMLDCYSKNLPLRNGVRLK